MGRSASGTLKLGALLLYSPDLIRAMISLCFFLTQLACCKRTGLLVERSKSRSRSRLYYSNI
jgi:hypothetical protein